MTVALGLLALPLAADAQPAGKKLPRVAVVLTTSPVAEMAGPDPIHPHVRGFVHGLRDLGWVDGRAIVIERRSAEGKMERALAIFAELVREKVDVIVTINRFARAAREATGTIPIVLATASGSPIRA